MLRTELRGQALCLAYLWPLVLIPSPGGRAPDSIDQDSFYEEFHRFSEGDERTFFVHDLRGV